MVKYSGCRFCVTKLLYGADRLTINAGLDKDKCSDNGIGFGTCRSFSLSDGSKLGKNVIFDSDMSSLVHSCNKKKDILDRDKYPTNGLDDTMLTTRKKYFINFLN